MVSDQYWNLEGTLQQLYNRNMGERCKSLRNHVVDNSALEFSTLELNGFILKTRKLKDKIVLGIMHWYMPLELKVIVNLWLEENWGPELKEVKEVLLTSKEMALGWILVQEFWNNNDFFGNIACASRLERICRLMSLPKKRTSQPRKKTFRRGYNDKGSLRPLHRSLGYDYRKLMSVSDQISLQEEEAQRVSALFQRIRERLLLENVS